MKKTLLLFAAALLMTACGNQEARLKERAAELCMYIPDHELRDESRDYMTEDFYMLPVPSASSAAITTSTRTSTLMNGFARPPATNN